MALVVNPTLAQTLVTATQNKLDLRVEDNFFKRTGKAVTGVPANLFCASFGMLQTAALLLLAIPVSFVNFVIPKGSGRFASNIYNPLMGKISNSAGATKQAFTGALRYASQLHIDGFKIEEKQDSFSSKGTWQRVKNFAASKYAEVKSLTTDDVKQKYEQLKTMVSQKASEGRALAEKYPKTTAAAAAILVLGLCYAVGRKLQPVNNQAAAIPMNAGNGISPKPTLISALKDIQPTSLPSDQPIVNAPVSAVSVAVNHIPDLGNKTTILNNQTEPGYIEQGLNKAKVIGFSIVTGGFVIGTTALYYYNEVRNKLGWKTAIGQ